MRRLTKKEYVLAGVFAFVAMFPLATATDGVYSVDILPPLGSVVGRREIIELMNERNQFLREKAKLMEVCQNRDDAQCPDINDPAAVRRFLRGLSSVVHPAAGTGAVEIVHTIFDLTDHQRGMLRRFERLRTCPETLSDILPGFYELCVKTLEESDDNRPMLKTNRMIPVDFFPGLQGPTLEEIIDMKKFSRPE